MGAWTIGQETARSSGPKENIIVSARVVSVCPNRFGTAGGGLPSTHVIAIETADHIIDCVIDKHSATLLRYGLG